MLIIMTPNFVRHTDGWSVHIGHRGEVRYAETPPEVAAVAHFSQPPPMPEIRAVRLVYQYIRNDFIVYLPKATCWEDGTPLNAHQRATVAERVTDGCDYLVYPCTISHEDDTGHVLATPAATMEPAS